MASPLRAGGAPFGQRRAVATPLTVVPGRRRMAWFAVGLTMLVGIRPTTGRISRYGVIPITADQDTAGPMARTVTDAAILLGALESAAPDPNDPATSRCTPPAGRDYTKFLKPDALRGARIGIPRAFYYDRLVTPGEPTPATPPEGRGGRGGCRRTDHGHPTAS